MKRLKLVLLVALLLLPGVLSTTITTGEKDGLNSLGNLLTLDANGNLYSCGKTYESFEYKQNVYNSSDGSTWDAQRHDIGSNFTYYTISVLENDGNVFVLQQDTNDNYVIYNQTTPLTSGSADWDKNLVLDADEVTGSPISTYQPPVAVDSSGNLWTAIALNSDYNFTFYKSTDEGATWSDVGWVDTANAFSTNYGPAMCEDGSGNIHFIAVTEHTGNDVSRLVYANSTNWDSINLTDEKGDDDYGYDITCDANGVYVFYVWYNDTSSPFNHYSIMAWNSSDGGATWENETVLDYVTDTVKYVRAGVTNTGKPFAVYNRGYNLYTVHRSGDTWYHTNQSLTGFSQSLGVRYSASPSYNNVSENTDGVTGINIVYQDGSENFYYHDYLNLTEDASPPSASNAHQNVTNDTTVALNTPVALGDKWSDDVALDMYVIEDDGVNGTWSSFGGGSWTNTTITVDSDKVVRTFANDTAGKEAKGSVWSYTVDSSSPTPTNSHSNLTNDTTICKYSVLEFGDQWTDNVELDMYVVEAGGSNGTWTSFSTGNWTNTTITIDTDKVIRIFANDTSGNEGKGGVWSYTLDSTSPTFLNVGTNVTNNTVTSVYENIALSAQWSDNLELDRYWVYDGTSNLSSVEFSTGNWSNFTWNTTGLTKGSTYTPKVFANDTSGNEIQGPVWSYTLDNTDPTYSNYGANVTNKTVMKNGTRLSVYSQFTDDVRLDFYSLSRNETSSWVNGTWSAFTTGNWTNTTLDTSDYNSTKWAVRVYANDTSANDAKTSLLVFTTDRELPKVYSFYLNDTYINLNESVQLLVNATDDITVAAVLAEWQLANGTYLNYSLSELATGNWSKNFTQADFGSTENKAGLLNLTRIFVNDTQTYPSNNAYSNTTSLDLTYAVTNTLLLEDHPDPAGNVSDTVVFTADYESSEATDIEGNCTLTIYHTNGTDLYFQMTYGSNHSYSQNFNWTIGGYEYNISCLNTSYESQWATGNFELIDPSVDASPGGVPGGGGGSLGYECLEDYQCEEGLVCLENECANASLVGVGGEFCGDEVCSGEENETSCPEDCLFSLLYSPAELSFKNLKPGDLSTRNLKLTNPLKEKVIVKLRIEEEQDESFTWAFFGASAKTKEVQYVIEGNSSQDIELTVNCPHDAAFGSYEFQVEVEQEGGTNRFVPVELEVYKEANSWEMLMMVLKKEYKLNFADGRYLYLPPIFQGEYLSWRWLYALYSFLGVVVFLVVLKIITSLINSFKPRPYPRRKTEG